MVKMYHVPHADPIDLLDWTFFEVDEDSTTLADLILIKAFAGQATTILRREFAKAPPNIDLPFVWGGDGDGIGGPAVHDPVTLHLSVPLGESEDAQVVYVCSFDELIDEFIDGLTNPQTDKIEEPEAQQLCFRLIKRLRELCEKIEAACELKGDRS